MTKPTATAMTDSSTCWISAGCSVSCQCCGDPLRAEPTVVHLARAALAEVRDDRPAGDDHGTSTSRAIEPTTFPLVIGHREPVDALLDHERERVTACRRTGDARPVGRRTELHLGDGVECERLQRAVGADELGDEVVGRVLEDRHRRVVLRELSARPEDRHPVAELDRLVDVVRDEHDRLPHLLLEAEELVLQPRAHDRIDGGERLVHEHQRRVGRDRAREADTLTLSAGELCRIPGRVRRVEADEVEELVRARMDP